MTLPVTIPDELRRRLLEIEGRGYKAYKQFEGTHWDYGSFQLKFEHVQGDPFAAPSRLSVSISLEESGFNLEWVSSPTRCLGLEDYLLRRFHRAIDDFPTGVRGAGKSGLVTAQRPSQKILKRNAVLVSADHLQLVFFAGLPANGRRILARQCLKIFQEVLPRLWEKTLLMESLDVLEVQAHLDTLEDFEALQVELEKQRWAAFVADHSLLPRRSGNSDLPLEQGGVPFMAPNDFSVEVTLPHAGPVRGMAIPQGITLIVGGGFHGKSTLLRALEAAVYPHIQGDGRERVATHPNAVKIRAEDGRAVMDVDISAFMDELPLVKDTHAFSTQAASGSTSQAVNIVEAMETGAQLLLMDEDTCATNFMIRDARMQALVAKNREPITPLLDRVEEMYEGFGVSSILVMGGSGDYFDVAHQVIAMEAYRPTRVTEEAKRIARQNPTGRRKELRSGLSPLRERRIDPSSLNFQRQRRECVIQAHGLESLVMGRDEVDARYLEQLVENGQLEFCGWILRELKSLIEKGTVSNVSALKIIFRRMDEEGFDFLVPYNNGLLSRPRLQEVAAVLNRLRGMKT